MKVTPTPGSVAGRRIDRAGDPLEGLVNLFDLSLVLAVGLLLAALSSIGAAGLITPSGGASGTPLSGSPATSGATGQGQGQAVGTVYRLSDGRYIFSPSSTSTVTGSTSATGIPSSPTGVTGAGASVPTGSTTQGTPGGT